MLVERIWTGNAYRNYNYLVACGETGEALAIDLGLLALFAVQHSGMARPAFKRWWTKFVPEAAERSTYVLMSSLLLVGLFVLWQPIGGVVWDAPEGAARTTVITFYMLGWALLLCGYLYHHNQHRPHSVGKSLGGFVLLLAINLIQWWASRRPGRR